VLTSDVVSDHLLGAKLIVQISLAKSNRHLTEKVVLVT